jgi:hypothetical protein
MSHCKHSALVAGLVSFSLASGTSTVYAHGGDASLIHGCVKNGTIRIVKATEAFM